jgi:hypothetical protein
MNYFVYRPDADNFAGIAAASDQHDDIVDIHYNDAALSSTWTPLVCHGFDDNPPHEGDFPSLSDFWQIPVMSKRAWDTLSPLIRYCCEPLAIVHPSGKPFYLVHVMDTLDCLDFDRSDVKRYTDGGVMRIVRYSFKRGMLNGKHIFKLRRDIGGELLVDDDFRIAVECHGLKGLVFRQVPIA